MRTVVICADPERAAREPGSVVTLLTELGGRVSVGRFDLGGLVETPILLAVTVSRLPALDFSIGYDDFVLMPSVPAELYGRVRQLDWRAATFGSEEVNKVDDLVIDIAGNEAKIGGHRY